MKCPNCGHICPNNFRICDSCGSELPVIPAQPREKDETARPKRTGTQKLFIILGWLIVVFALNAGFFKLSVWRDTYQITRLYTRGEYTPTIANVTLADGRAGHAFIFYGEDGDQIYISELDRVLTICGGIARIEIADSDWFGERVDEYDYADISFTPLLISKGGKQVQLPIIHEQIDVPVSPLTVTTPAKNGTNVVTSTYPLALQVIYGSRLFINGTDLTSEVDRAGDLNITVAVKPIGDNTFTVVVRTPHHKENRYDIVLYRQKYDIEIELDSQVATKSTETTMTISGTCEPGAEISVDNSYIEKSFSIDMTTGKFSFIAKFDTLGSNIVRFRARKEGRQDAVVSFTVNYTPTLAQYSAKAWKMDYPQLSKYFESWLQRIFKCVGPVVDRFTDNGTEYIIMDVNPGGDQQLVVLQNYSDTTPTIGPSYTAWADVTGRYYYQSNYYPMLAVRYLDMTT